MDLKITNTKVMLSALTLVGGLIFYYLNITTPAGECSPCFIKFGLMYGACSFLILKITGKLFINKGEVEEID